MISRDDIESPAFDGYPAVEDMTDLEVQEIYFSKIQDIYGEVTAETLLLFKNFIKQIS